MPVRRLRRTPPDGTAWFGTDRLGRDVYARVVHGARPILIAAPAATLIAAVIGTLLGLLTGYFRGWVDEIISRLLEAILSIPSILLAIVIVFHLRYDQYGHCRRHRIPLYRGRSREQSGPPRWLKRSSTT